MELNEYLALQPDMKSTGPLSDLDILLAENELDINFSEDYKSMLRSYGAVRVNEHDINGLSKVRSFSVVAMTKSAREIECIPNDMYVIESLGIDDVLILQNGEGEVFECRGKK